MKKQIPNSTNIQNDKPTSAAATCSHATLARATKLPNLPAEPPAALFEAMPADPLASVLPMSTSASTSAAAIHSAVPPQSCVLSVSQSAGKVPAQVGVALPVYGTTGRASPARHAAADTSQTGPRRLAGEVDYLEAITRYLVWRGHPIKQARTLADISVALSTLRSTRRRRGPRLFVRDGHIHATDGVVRRSTGVAVMEGNDWRGNVEANVKLSELVEHRVMRALGRVAAVGRASTDL